MITASQIRAARALLDWSQSELAERAKLTQATIANIEVEKHQPSKTTITALEHTFQSVGIEFLANGVRQVRGITQFVGNDAILRLFENVYFTLRGSSEELLISGADERQNRPGVEAAVTKIREAGIKMRVLVDEENHYLLGPLDEYRCVPAKYFLNNPTIIYGDRVALPLFSNGADHIQVILNASLAAAERNMFNFVWDHCRKPSYSEAKQVYFCKSDEG